MELGPLSEPSNWLSAVLGAVGAWAGFKKWNRSEQVEESKAQAVVSIHEGTRTLVELLTKQVLDLTKKTEAMQHELNTATASNRQCDELNRQMAQTIAAVRAQLERVQHEKESVCGTQPPLLHR